MACDCFIPSPTLILPKLLQCFRLESVLVFLSQYPEISDITGAPKLDCEGCIHPRCCVHCRLPLRASFRWRVLHSINSNIRLVFSWCTRSLIKVAKEERTIAMPITVTEPCTGRWTMFALSSVASFVSMRGCSKRHAELTLVLAVAL